MNAETNVTTPLDIPNGAIQAISTGASAALALEIAFLGYWAFGSQTANTPWHPLHLLGVIPLAIAFGLLAHVPFGATLPGIDAGAFKRVRNFYVGGISCLGLGLALSMALSVGSWFDKFVEVKPGKVEPTSFICNIRQ